MEKAGAIIPTRIHLAARVIVLAGFAWTGTGQVGEIASRRIVMIECQDQAGLTQGAGIITGNDSKYIYIATAQHIINNRTEATLKAQFYPKSAWFTAMKVMEAEGDNDFAVLKVELTADTSRFAENAKSVKAVRAAVLVRGDRLFAVGYPTGGSKWYWPIDGGLFDKLDGDSILFEDKGIVNGNSEGGVFTAKGELAGMVLSTSPPFAHAKSVDGILALLPKLRGVSNLELVNSSQISASEALAKGLQLARAEKCDGAVPLLERATKTYSDNAEVFYLLGRCQYAAKQFDSAIQTLNQAVNLNEQQPDYYRQLGLAKWKAGRFEPAIQDLRTAMEMEPTNASRAADVGRVYEDEGDFQKAIDFYYKAKTIEPGNKEWWMLLGQALLKNGDVRLGQELIDKARKVN